MGTSRLTLEQAKRLKPGAKLKVISPGGRAELYALLGKYVTFVEVTDIDEVRVQELTGTFYPKRFASNIYNSGGNV